MKKFNFDFIAKRKVFFAVPIIIAVITIITALVAGVPVDIEFKGGTMLTYSYAGDIDTKAVQATVEGMNLGTVGVTTGSAFGTDLETVQISFAFLIAGTCSALAPRIIIFFAILLSFLTDNPKKSIIFCH